MNDLAEQYSKMVECATELADFFLDQEGGTFTLTIVCEMLQILLRAGELSALGLIVETICEVSRIELPPEMVRNPNTQNFIVEQFAELLGEILTP